MNSKALKVQHKKIYERFFEEHQIVVSAPFLMTRAGDLSKYYSGITIKQKIPLRLYVGVKINKSKIISLQDITYFDKGNENAKFRGFLCSEIVKALGKAGYKFHFKYTGRMKKYNFPNNTIVHIKKSKKYPVGHYLCLTQKGWMDSWINFPRLNARAGFRKRLPGKPIYAIVPIT